MKAHERMLYTAFFVMLAAHVGLLALWITNGASLLVMSLNTALSGLVGFTCAVVVDYWKRNRRSI